jgi:hypothetical protein
MNITTQTINGQTYQVANGTFYHASTPVAVIRVLEAARADGKTIRIHVGDVNTGRDWLEEHDVKGTVGRSTGSIKIPLLIEKGEHGGSGLFDHCIVKILSVASGRTLYVNPNYTLGNLTLQTHSDVKGYTTEVHLNGAVHARFKDVFSACKWMTEMHG